MLYRYKNVILSMKSYDEMMKSRMEYFHYFSSDFYKYHHVLFFRSTTVHYVRYIIISRYICIILYAYSKIYFISRYFLYLPAYSFKRATIVIKTVALKINTKYATHSKMYANVRLSFFKCALYFDDLICKS